MGPILAYARGLAHGVRAPPGSCILAFMSADRISRRGFLAVALVGLVGTAAAAAGKPAVTVYKQPT